MKDKAITLKLEIDIRKMHLALVGWGYSFEDIEDLSENELITIWQKLFVIVILENYGKGVELGLYEDIGD